MPPGEDGAVQCMEFSSVCEHGTGFVVLSDDLAIAERFTVALTPPDRNTPICRMRIALENGRPVCTELECERQPGGPPITQAVLHTIPVAPYLRKAMEYTAFRFTRLEEEGWGEPIDVDAAPAWKYDTASRPGSSREVRDAARAIARSKLRQPRRGIPLSDDELREVATIYRGALAEGRRPTKAVMQAMHVGRATASRWLARARQRGHLGNVPRPGVAGETPIPKGP